MKKYCILYTKLAPITRLQINAQKDLLELLKTLFKKMEGSGSLNEKLNTFLFTYRNTPQSTTMEDIICPWYNWYFTHGTFNEQKIKFKT